MSFSKRQQVAIEHPFNNRDGKLIFTECHFGIGKFETILTVDIITKMPEEKYYEKYEWHVSVAITKNKIIDLNKSSFLKDLGKTPKEKLIKDMIEEFNRTPVVSLFMWDEDEYEKGIRLCRELLQSVGIKDGAYWYGEPFSLHYCKPLTEKEMSYVLGILDDNFKNYRN